MRAEEFTNDQVVLQAFDLAAALGVAEFVVAAGARNLPLVAAVAEFDRPIFQHFEERSAGFFALGRAIASGKPIAVITTSGTAVAELLPAVIEAHYQGVRIVVMSGDRPQRFRGSGAPQAIFQPGIFGSYVGETWDLGGRDGIRWQLPREIEPGPFHVNVCLEEPKDPHEPIGFGYEPVFFGIGGAPTMLDESLQFLGEAERPLIVVGALTPAEGRAVRMVLPQFGVPVLAEPISNLGILDKGIVLAGGERALVSYRPDAVLRLGGVPTWRWWRDLEDSETPVISLSRTGYAGLSGEARGQGADLSRFFYAAVADEPKQSDSRIWEDDERANRALASALKKFPQSECALLEAVARSIPDGAAVFIGNSLPIREWAMVCPAGSRELDSFANRGANGIDGNLSTGLGISEEYDETWIIVGDLTALYDMVAPWIIEQLSGGRVRIVVVNNGGGKIFGRLRSVSEANFEVQKLIMNQHNIEFSGVAALWRMGYDRAQTREEISDLDLPDIAFIEVCPDGGESERFWQLLSK